MRSLLLCLAFGSVVPATLYAQNPATAPRLEGRLSEMTHEQFSDWNYYNNLAWKSLAQNDLAKAETMFGRAIELARVEAATDPRLLARGYADLAWVLHRQGRDAEAEPLAKWALQVREKVLGADSKPVAQTIYTLGAIEVNLNNLDEAERLMARTLDICEKRYGTESLATADALDDLASVLVLRRNYGKARPTYDRALANFRMFGTDNPSQHEPLDGLATIDVAEGKLAEAEAHLTRAIEMVERDPIATPASHAKVLRRQAEVFRKTNRPDEAAKLEERAKAVAARPLPRGSLGVRPVERPRNGQAGAIRTRPTNS